MFNAIFGRRGSKSQAVMAKVDAVEAEMKRIGFWSSNPPDLQTLYNDGMLRTYLDAPSFELWLQCIFIPNAREAARTNQFPEKSQVGLMAMREYDYHERVPEAHTLLQLLREFDRLVERKT